MVFLKSNSCRWDFSFFFGFEFLGLASSDQNAKIIYWKNLHADCWFKRSWFRLSSFLVSSLHLPFRSSWIIFILWNGTWLNRTWALISHPSDPKEGKLIWGVAILHQPPKKLRGISCGWIFFKFLGSVKGFSYESKLLKAPEVGWNTITVPLFGFLRPFSDESSPILSFDSSNLWRIVLNKPKIPVTSHITIQGCEMLYFWHALRHCFNALSPSVKVQESNWISLYSRERRRWKWSQFLPAGKDWYYE